MARKPSSTSDSVPQEIPIQPVAKPILCSPFVSAVNHWNQLSRWDFLVCRDPQQLGEKINEALNGNTTGRYRYGAAPDGIQ